MTVASKLLNLINRNCIDIIDMCQGKTLATNILRDLCKDIHSDVIPKSWTSFTMDPTTNLNHYILDLQKRFNQFERLI